jgi:hypothetical protein
MSVFPDRDTYRELLDVKLTELGLYAKELCPEAEIEISSVAYEDEDGHVIIFPPLSVGRGRRKTRTRCCRPSWRYL